MNEEKWRFKGNNHTQESGIDTPDMETFAKDPLASLAREICQNSIDARRGEAKVKIEFNTFEIPKIRIPGYQRLLKEIESAISYWKDKNKIITETLNEMLYEINKDMITCLRISDFNTIGLKGVTDTEKSPFFLLTKGSGISDKTGTTGGSKGIGKFASFVASSFNTVFYYTQNLDDEEGYIGISKLCSTRIEGTDEKTIGIGYYSSDEKNSPILKNFDLDKNFKRTSPGTDVYILGFRKTQNWKKEIITKILDSFMYAIQNEDLEITINDTIIDNITLKEIVNNEELIISNSKKDLISQYALLNDKDVFIKEIEVMGYGEATIYLKGYDRKEASSATGRCVIIRYPYMKIKSILTSPGIPSSSMCVIGDNGLNEILRGIENPQHTNWEPKRINDRSLQQEVRSIIRNLESQIKDYIIKTLSSSDSKESDIEGAGDYLPDLIEDSGGSYVDNINEKPLVIKRIKNKIKETNLSTPADEDSGLAPDLGSIDEGEGTPFPEGRNEGKGKTPHDNENEGGSKEGDSEILKATALSGIRYYFFVVNKANSECVISFQSPYEKENCLLELNHLDDGNRRYKINILNANVNNKEAEVKDGNIINLSIKQNEFYKIKIKIDAKKIYASEVKLYENW